jgi:hypothetical protein
MQPSTLPSTLEGVPPLSNTGHCVAQPQPQPVPRRQPPPTTTGRKPNPIPNPNPRNPNRAGCTAQAAPRRLPPPPPGGIPPRREKGGGAAESQAPLRLDPSTSTAAGDPDPNPNPNPCHLCRVESLLTLGWTNPYRRSGMVADLDGDAEGGTRALGQGSGGRWRRVRVRRWQVAGDTADSLNSRLRQRTVALRLRRGLAELKTAPAHCRPAFRLAPLSPHPSSSPPPPSPSPPPSPPPPSQPPPSLPPPSPTPPISPDPLLDGSLPAQRHGG